MMRIKQVFCFTFATLIMFAQIALAQEDRWLDSLRNSRGMSVGTLEPRYPELEGKKPAETEGIGAVGPVTGGPIDPNRLNPGSPDVAGHIRQWVTIARPPENAVEGANVRYSGRGNVVGTVPGGIISSPHETGTVDPVYLWTNKRTLDSIDHCTLEEYVVAKLEQKAVSHCAGRYGAVKDLKGMKLAQAKAAVTNKGFTYTLAPGSPAKTPAEDGAIEKQEPLPTQYLKKGDSVKLFVHSPYVAQVPALPDFTGKPLAEAKKWLKKNRLTAKLTPGRPAPSKNLSGAVQEQEPRPGTKIGAGKTVTLAVYSKFVDVRQVPDVKGLPVAKAKERLGSAGFGVELRPGGKPSSQQQAGTVERQEPPAGTRVLPGAPVELVVYAGYAPPVAVPDVRNLSWEEARNRIAGLGLAAERRDAGHAANSRQANTVRDQKPAAGAKVERGAAVIVSVYGPYTPTRDELIAGYDCSKVTNSHAEWDSAVNAPRCYCNPGYVLDTAHNVCVAQRPPTRDELVRGYDCSRVTNSHAAWDTAVNAPRCYCNPGYVLDTAHNVCVAPRPPTRDELVRGYDCSRVANSHPAWDNQTNAPRCFCNQGFTLDARNNRCVPVQQTRPADNTGDCEYKFTMIVAFMNNYRANPSNQLQKTMADQTAAQARQMGCDRARINQALGSGGRGTTQPSRCPPGMIMGTKPGTWGQEEACVPAALPGRGGTSGGPPPTATPRSAPPACPGPGVTPIYNLWNPPPYGGLGGLICQGGGRMWINVSNNVYPVTSIQRGTQDPKSGCWYGTKVVTPRHTYEGKLCRK